MRVYYGVTVYEMYPSDLVSLKFGFFTHKIAQIVDMHDAMQYLTLSHSSKFEKPVFWPPRCATHQH